MEQNNFFGKVFGTVLKWGKFTWAWGMSFVKTKSCTFSLHKAKKNLDAATATLGMEVYALFSRGEVELRTSPVIMQQLKIVEEAEARVLGLQARIDSINEEYRQRKETISA